MLYWCWKILFFNEELKYLIDIFEISWTHFQKQLFEMFCKKGALKNFAIFWIEKKHTGKVGPRIRDSWPRTYTWDPGLGTHHLGAFIWDAGPGTHRQDLGPLHMTCDLGPSTWNLAPKIRDPIYGNRDSIPFRGTQDLYLETLILIQLSLN